MPQVGDRKYDYTPEGVAKARREQLKARRPLQMNPNQNRTNVNPNRGAVNNFMNRNAVNNVTSNVNPTPNQVRGLQRGLNFLGKTRPSFTPLKVDGIMGPKTQTVSDNFLGKSRRMGNRRLNNGRRPKV